MTHFAEIVNGKVVRIIVATQQEINKNYNGKWVQTSYNNSIRKQYAGIGMTYDEVKDKFIFAKPHPSWVLDSNDDWIAPKPMPTSVADEKYEWHESVKSWVTVK